jgi:hypothetical protein
MILSRGESIYVSQRVLPKEVTPAMYRERKCIELYLRHPIKYFLKNLKRVPSLPVKNSFLEVV